LPLLGFSEILTKKMREVRRIKIKKQEQLRRMSVCSCKPVFLSSLLKYQKKGKTTMRTLEERTQAALALELGVVGFIHNSLLYIDPRSRRMYV
jgi:hypothetical protein